MDSADGTSVGHTVVSYQGPYLDSNGVPNLKRTSGNGVTMEIGFEPLDKRPLRVVSKKPDGSVIANTELSYDAKGNITRIEDKINPARTQSFTLDNLGRVTQGTGKYGTQNYSFSVNGNSNSKRRIYIRLYRRKSRKCSNDRDKPKHWDVELRIRCEWEYDFEKRRCAPLRQLWQTG
ncbi:hypothetical protein LEP1GSC039_2816 [Leptospira santarosai str. 2000027870]|nr:hypothetical protein LEP1GSC039_2816 [Leptospira santarosai str. 2000027870]